MNDLYEYAAIYGCDSSDVSSGEFDWSDVEDREYTEYIGKSNIDKDWSMYSWYKPWYQEFIEEE